MNCPACFHKLTEVQVGAVAVDVCHGGCGGLWFDAFELQRVDEEHEAAGEHLLNIPRDPARRIDPDCKRDCPRCASIKLMRHRFNPKSSVEVDHCPNCSGYWLDSGELEKIRKENESARTRPSAQKVSVSMEVIRYLYRIQTGQQTQK